MHPSTIGHTQTGAEIMRVGNTIEYEQQGFAFNAINQLGQGARHRHFFSQGNDALVTVMAG